MNPNDRIVINLRGRAIKPSRKTPAHAGVLFLMKKMRGYPINLEETYRPGDG